MNGPAKSTEHARVQDGLDHADHPPLLGAENSLARDLLSAAEFNRTESWSPLLLYGDSGSGKSFIARQLATVWSSFANTNDASFTDSSTTSGGPEETGEVYFTTAYEIIRLFMPSRLKSDLEASRTLYQAASLLVIDDVEHLVDRELACGWLAAVLDTRHDLGLCSIVTAKSIAALRQLPSALFSRLTSGLPVRCFLPSAATRRLIILDVCGEAAKDASWDTKLPQIIKQSEGLSVAATRTLALALTSEASKSNLNSNLNTNITSTDDSQLVVPNVASDDFARACLKAVARRFGVRVADMKGSSRRKNTVMARSVAMFLIREFTSLSLIDTGRFFQNRDHTTVRHACNKVKKLLLNDAQIQEAVQSLCSTLQENYNVQWTIQTESRCA